MYTIREIMAELKVSEPTVRRWIRFGHKGKILKATYVGKGVRITEEALAEFLGIK